MLPHISQSGEQTLQPWLGARHVWQGEVESTLMRPRVVAGLGVFACWRTVGLPHGEGLERLNPGGQQGCQRRAQRRPPPESPRKLSVVLLRCCCVSRQQDPASHPCACRPAPACPTATLSPSGRDKVPCADPGATGQAVLPVFAQYVPALNRTVNELGAETEVPRTGSLPSGEGGVGGACGRASCGPTNPTPPRC